jgi:hypothetical protein
LGIGGGIYNDATGIVKVHGAVVVLNQATTSDDDVFGVLTPF